MHSRNEPIRTVAALAEPAPTRKRRARATPGKTRRRSRAAAMAEAMPEHTPSEADLGPILLYREEKARRSSPADVALMVEAKRLYDELIAESGIKRAGMRDAVVAKQRGVPKPEK
jgi:hypothetical protein